MSGSPVLRRAVRAFLVDPCERVLLVRFVFDRRDLWCAPGGGMDHGEQPVQALRRELLEEVGLDLSAEQVGSCVAHRVHLFPMAGGYDGQEEWFYLVRVPAFSPRGMFTDEQLRAENMHELRWWSLDALRGVPTAPRDLPEVLERWLTGGVRGGMLELGV